MFRFGLTLIVFTPDFLRYHHLSSMNRCMSDWSICSTAFEVCSFSLETRQLNLETDFCIIYNFYLHQSVAMQLSTVNEKGKILTK